METTEINKLLNLEAIKNLRIRYAHYLDSNNIDGLISLFTEEAICQTDRDPWRGREEIRKGLVKAFKDYDTENHGSYPFLHAITNHWIEMINSDTAQGRCYLIDLVTERPKNASTLLLLGLYSDEYKKIGDQWFISRSRLDLVWPERNVEGGEPGKNLNLPS